MSFDNLPPSSEDGVQKELFDDNGDALKHLKEGEESAHLPNPEAPDKKGDPPSSNPEAPDKKGDPPSSKGGVLNPFDPEKFRISNPLLSGFGVKKALTTIPVTRPPVESFIRCHPDPKFSLETNILDYKGEGAYILDPSLWGELTNEPTCSPRLIQTAITREGNLFLWPLRLLRADGRDNEWTKSALKAANLARTNWIRVSSNMELGAYQVKIATEDLGNPEWPDLTFQDLFNTAFKGRYISHLDHPILKRLRGER